MPITRRNLLGLFAGIPFCRTSAAATLPTKMIWSGTDTLWFLPREIARLGAKLLQRPHWKVLVQCEIANCHWLLAQRYITRAECCRALAKIRSEIRLLESAANCQRQNASPPRRKIDAERRALVTGLQRMQ